MSLYWQQVLQRLPTNCIMHVAPIITIWNRLDGVINKWSCQVFTYLFLLVRMFNVSVDTDEPEQTLHLCPARPKGFCADADEFEAVSFCLGTACTSDWTCLTLFGLLKSGSVISICPVLPNQSILPPDLLDCLAKQTQIDSKNSVNAQYYWRSKWLKEIIANQSGDHVVSPKLNIEVARCGPYLVEPQSETMDMHMQEYMDIKCISSELCPVILVASSLKIQISLLFDPCVSAWQTTEVLRI